MAKIVKVRNENSFCSSVKPSVVQGLVSGSNFVMCRNPIFEKPKPGTFNNI